MSKNMKLQFLGVIDCEGTELKAIEENHLTNFLLMLVFM